jgi:predicted  nucleic acid-binding Zn-ribbon protein
MATIEIPFPLSSLSMPPRDEAPSEDLDARVHLVGSRKQRLKERYGWGQGLPKISRETALSDQLERADALREIGLEKRADRAEICGRVGELFECAECGRAFKRKWGCRLRSCPACAEKIFADAFSELLPLESHVPSALASLPGWGWKVLDLTFRHNGEFPSREEMRKMRGVVNRVVDRAVREKCREMYRAGLRCRIRFSPGTDVPMLFEGWPVASAADGSARVLEGWTVVQVGRVGKRPTCIRCGSRVKKIKKELARLCPKCGPVRWPDWENEEVDSRRWKLRFGTLQVAVSEFGYEKESGSPNCNYHFHTCFFGPFLEQKRLVELFRKESLKTLGVESRGVWIEKAKRGYRSALAHALKYTAKIPATTAEGLAKYEQILLGVRRYAVRGFLQGVLLEEEKRAAPECPDCKTPLKRIAGLGVVPLCDVEDIPFLPEEKRYEDSFPNDEVCFLEPEEVAARAPRAP